MGTILASTLIAIVQADLRDDTTFYDDAFLLDALNEGQRTVVLLKPSANAVGESLQLAEGIEQSLPSTGFQFIELQFNRGAGGTDYGKGIRLVKREKLDLLDPDWRGTTASATVEMYMFNPDNPTKFEVYPPQPASSQGYVQIVYAKPPVDVSLTTDPITIADIYQTPLLQFMHYKARVKDNQYEQAQLFYQMFLGSMGQKSQTEAVKDPNKDRNP